MDDLVRQRSQAREKEAVSKLKNFAEALPHPEDKDSFGRFFGRYGDASVVLLGEASHGTREFYLARAAISRHLIRHCGFNIVAVEADWPDAARIDRFVRHHPPEATAEKAFDRFPSWMWRNAEVLQFAQWLRSENESRPAQNRVEFRGLDIYSLQNSIAAVLRYLDRVDKNAAREARRRYGCLTPWQSNPALYGNQAILGGATCEDEVEAQLVDILKRRLEYSAQDGDTFFGASQNAHIVRAAEQYYRAMYKSSRDSWNLRDRHMFDTLQRLMKHRGPKTKVIVWAHNSHVGNAAATSMGWEGEFNIGELCRNAFGNDLVSIGFGTDHGLVAAASDWDSPMEIKAVRPARADSYEHLFHLSGYPRCLANWREANHPLREVLSEPRLERAIGVVYRPESELLSHYFRAVLSDQFDAYVWFDSTAAITPLLNEPKTGTPETYPFGL